MALDAREALDQDMPPMTAELAEQAAVLLGSQMTAFTGLRIEAPRTLRRSLRDRTCEQQADRVLALAVASGAGQTTVGFGSQVEGRPV